MTYHAQLERLAHLYENLDRARLPAQLAEIYAESACFKDPFNEVSGLAAIAAVFDHMYEQVDAPRFFVRTRILDGADAFLIWDFEFRWRGGDAPQRIQGGTHLRFGPDGKVLLHRDYWDAAEELYEKLPVLGALMRWLKRRVRR